jgi:hypothetical protein
MTMGIVMRTTMGIRITMMIMRILMQRITIVGRTKVACTVRIKRQADDCLARHGRSV